MKLTDRFIDEVEFKEQTISLNMAFDNILRVSELLDDETFSDGEKVLILFEMLVIDANKFDFSFMEINQLIGFLIEEIIFPNKEGDKKPALFDLNQDAAFIYASFLQDYKIDLFEMQGKMHWQKFLALMESLSEDTKFKEVVGIRSQKIPAPTKYNQEERKQLIELKRIYRLHNQKPSTEEADEILTAFANSLKRPYQKR
jgi:Bacteriophage Gp15 protein